MPRCLITGATGFIGPRLVRVLQAAGGDVRCLIRPNSDTSQLAPLDVRLLQGDVTDAASLAAGVAGVDFVFHLAGRTMARNYDAFAEVNETGSANMAAACAAQTTPPVLVAVSSLAAAGPSPVGGALTEREPPEPVSNYGRSKLAGELAIREWASEVPISVVRPPVVFGPGDRAGFVLVQSLRKMGLHLVHRPGLPLSLIHADDLAAALMLVARHGERLDPTDPRGTGVYNAADPNPSSYTEMGEMIAAALGRKIRVLRVRKWALRMAALVGEAIGRVSSNSLPLNLDKLAEGTASGWVASTTKITSQLNFQPAAPLAERYRETIDWYRSAGWIRE